MTTSPSAPASSPYQPPLGPETRAWIVTDGKIGMVNQCVALAEALGVSFGKKTIRLRQPWHALVPWLRWGLKYAVKNYADQLTPPFPDIVIATGRISTAGSLYLKAATKGRAFVVQIQNPGIDPANFDVLVTPRHDGLAGPNVLSTRGAMHALTRPLLDAAAAQWAPRFAHLKRPYVAVLLGGSNAVYRFGAAEATALALQLRALAQQGYSFLITPSRRTGAAQERILADNLQGLPAWLWDGEGENPYRGLLGLADYVLVTGDSVNMVTEATSTGKPVYVVELPGGSPKFNDFHTMMRQDGFTRPFTGSLENWHYPEMNDTFTVATEIARRYAAHRRRFGG